MTATSTTESETMAAHSTVIEAVWERRLAKDLGHPETGPTLVWEDNRQVILHANHDGLHRATKHFLTKYHYKRELVAEGIVVFQPLATNRMLADYLTKSVPRIKSVFMREAFLGVAIVQRSMELSHRNLKRCWCPEKRSLSWTALEGCFVFTGCGGVTSFVGSESCRQGHYEAEGVCQSLKQIVYMRSAHTGRVQLLVKGNFRLRKTKWFY